jgi:hypothetical protein
MSEDITEEPLPPSRPELPEELPDYAPLDSLEAAPYPWQVTAAGVLWIVLGVLMLIFMCLLGAPIMIRAAAQNAPPSTGLLTWLGFTALFGLSLIVIGVQATRGAVRQFGSNVAVSVGIGLFDIGSVVVKAANGQFDRPNLGLILLTAVNVLTGILLLSAGVLALLGKSQYEQWRKTPQADSTRRSRFYKQNLPIGDERLLKESPANLCRGWQRVGGWLYLTDQRLLYRPQRFSFRKQQTTQFNIDKDEFSIPLAEIEDVGAFAVGGIVPTGLQVTTSMGVRKFVISDRGAWVEAIANARGFYS